MTGSPARTVLTTGANSGIGLATTLALARRGFRSVGSVRSAAKADLVTEAAAEADLEVETVLLDVTDADRCRAVIDELRPWGLVNNAGYGQTGAIEDVDDDEAQRLIDTMVMAPLRLCRLAVPHMREANDGRIVNMSSIFGLTSGPLIGWYAGAKHALEALTDALRVEVASSGIRVSLVEPGGIKTNIWDDVASDLDRRAGSRFGGSYRRSLSGTRLARPIMGDPDQVAAVVIRAITTHIPRERYLVGLDAQALSVVQRLTPTIVRDTVTKFGLGL
jgi:NAD(P)-dependent dehydrogenase (short-subunit alcohol dehydrogenase family)